LGLVFDVAFCCVFFVIEPPLLALRFRQQNPQIISQLDHISDYARASLTWTSRQPRGCGGVCVSLAEDRCRRRPRSRPSPSRSGRHAREPERRALATPIGAATRARDGGGADAAWPGVTGAPRSPGLLSHLPGRLA